MFFAKFYVRQFWFDLANFFSLEIVIHALKPIFSYCDRTYVESCCRLFVHSLIPSISSSVVCYLCAKIFENDLSKAVQRTQIRSFTKFSLNTRYLLGHLRRCLKNETVFCSFTKFSSCGNLRCQKPFKLLRNYRIFIIPYLATI